MTQPQTGRNGVQFHDSIEDGLSKMTPAWLKRVLTTAPDTEDTTASERQPHWKRVQQIMTYSNFVIVTNVKIVNVWFVIQTWPHCDNILHYGFACATRDKTSTTTLKIVDLFSGRRVENLVQVCNRSK